MQQKAFWLAEKWVLSNYRVFNTTNSMWEKYNVIGNTPVVGKGGEYEPQSGFGWTNGVVLDLLSTYSDRLHFFGLDSNADKVANEVIQREQPEPNLKTLLINETENDTNSDIDSSYTLALQKNNNANTQTTLSMLFNLCILFIGWWIV